MRDGLCRARARAYEHTRKQIISDAQSRPDLFLEIVIPFQELFFGINNVLYISVSRARAWVLSLAVPGLSTLLSSSLPPFSLSHSLCVSN